MSITSRVVALLCVVTLVGCTTYSPQVTIPDKDTDAATWKTYYRDQFKAYGADGVPTPATDAPEVQQSGYQQAQQAWKASQTLGLTAALVAFALGLGSLLGTLNGTP